MERTTSASWPFSLVSELDHSFWLREDFPIAGQAERERDVVGEGERIRESEQAIGFYGRGG